MRGEYSAGAHSRAEKDLRSSRDQLEIILQGVADGITVQDPAGNLIFANNAAARILGYASAEELLASPLPEVMRQFQVLDDSGNPFLVDQLPGRLALAGETQASALIRFRIKDSSEEHWSLVKATPIFNQSGQVEMAVNIFQDVTDLKRIETTQRMLAEAGNLVAASLDSEKTMKSVADLAVAYLADWCAIIVVEENQPPRFLAVAHQDPEKVKLALRLQELYPLDWNAEIGIANVLKTGKPEFYPEIDQAILESAARDAEHYQMLREIGFRSALILPLTARGRTLGAMTLAWAESRKMYSQNDVDLAEELARRAALAIDNARLYNESQTLNVDLEARVAKRTAQLQSIITKLRTEIAERRKVEEALRKNETLLQSLFESAPDATILINEAGKIEDANLQAENLFGYRREELLGQTVDILLPKRYQKRHKDHRSSYYNDPRRRPMGASLDLYGLRKDGTEIPIDIMLSPVQTEAGMLVISAIRDISERKQMEVELAEVQQQLSESVEAERSHLAQELHDGPIQDLYAISYQLKGLEVDARDRISLGSTHEAMHQVITQLRSICGELRPPALAPFGLEKAILAHLEQVRDKYPELEVEAELMADRQIIPNRIRLALYRVFQHAVSNVLRHAQANTLSVRFTFDEEEIYLEIKDDGCGFELPRRWVELARQGHLGLVGTAERAEAIGGQLDILTSPGKGTVIVVTVPRNDRTLKTYHRSLHRIRIP